MLMSLIIININMSDKTELETMPDVSLFDIPLDMIKAPIGANGEIELEEDENRENPHNAEISSKVRNLRWEISMQKDDLEGVKQMLEDGSYVDWGSTEEATRELMLEIESNIERMNAEIEALQKDLIIKPKGTIKELVRNVIPVYAQTLRQRGYDPENAMLASAVNVSPVFGVPGRYMMHMRIKGLSSSSLESSNASMLLLETSVNDIDDKSPMRNRHFVLANVGGRTQLLGTYQQLLEQADAMGITIAEYLKQKYKIEQSSLMEFWLGDAERAVD